MQSISARKAPRVSENGDRASLPGLPSAMLAFRYTDGAPGDLVVSRERGGGAGACGSPRAAATSLKGDARERGGC
jgi:hypothetical protein